MRDDRGAKPAARRDLHAGTGFKRRPMLDGLAELVGPVARLVQGAVLEQRDEAMQARVFSFVDDSHSASAELFEDAVVRNCLPDHWCRILRVCSWQVNGAYKVLLNKCIIGQTEIDF